MFSVKKIIQLQNLHTRQMSISKHDFAICSSNQLISALASVLVLTEFCKDANPYLECSKRLIDLCLLRENVMISMLKTLQLPFLHWFQTEPVSSHFLTRF